MVSQGVGVRCHEKFDCLSELHYVGRRGQCMYEERQRRWSEDWSVGRRSRECGGSLYEVMGSVSGEVWRGGHGEW